MKEWKELSIQIGDLARSTGRWIAEEQSDFNSERVEIKDHNSLVSYVDKRAEEQLVEGLSQLLPEAGFITEEATVTNERKELSWVVDPLDGTTNFIHGIPLYAVSIGLLQEDELVCGVVYECGRDELFRAALGSGAFCNGTPIRVSAANELSQSVLATGFPYHDFSRVERFNKLLADLYRSTRGLRRCGSAATDLAWVACGRFDGFFEYGLNSWDVAGGALLVKEAGGRLSDFQGADDFLFGKSIISSNSHIFEAFQQMVKGRMESDEMDRK